MKKYNILAIFLIGLVALLSSCHSPDDLKPAASRIGINSITAKFPNADGTFSGEFKGFAKEGSDEIIIEIPYFFPENSDNQVTSDMLKKMRVSAELAENATISPAILFMDMNEDNIITVKDQVGDVKNYTVRANVVKSRNAYVEEFKIPALGISGVINDATKEISLVTTLDLGVELASIKLSPHATVSPDPSVEALDYSKDIQLTITAYDGVTKNVYTVKKSIPNKVEKGIRDGSAKVLFEKRLEADLGITTLDMTGGIAVSGDYIVLNTRGQASTYINAKTGEKAGAINLGAITGSLTNFYNTADEDGNILINNLANNAGTFKVWKLSSVTGTPELFIDWAASGTHAVGRKVSVKGSLNTNAIITAPLHNVGNQFARWTVVDGKLTSHTPELVTITGYAWSNTNVDIVATSSTDVKKDYIVIGYSDNRLARINGETNALADYLQENDKNFISNAVDHVHFNNGQYVVYNHINSFTWGAADQVWMLSADRFSGTASSSAVWASDKNKYGANAIGSKVNGNGTGDVVFKVSEDGYFLYMYFMFTNGYVVGIQFDCIDM